MIKFQFLLFFPQYIIYAACKFSVIHYLRRVQVFRHPLFTLCASFPSSIIYAACKFSVIHYLRCVQVFRHPEHLCSSSAKDHDFRSFVAKNAPQDDDQRNKR